MTVTDMARLMEEIAPSVLAEDWDNCGLQVGRWEQPVQTVWVALDPSPEVITAACEEGVDLLITHHPLLFRPLKSVDFSRMPGRALEMAAFKGLSVFSAHTNLDSATGGLNDICADRLGLKERRVLAPAAGARHYKLVFFVPEAYEQKMLEVLAGSRAGTVGKYSCCSFTGRGTGRFKPLEEADPFIGSAGEIASTEEVRIETVVAASDVKEVVALLKASHPYETMAYDILPLSGSIEPQQGLGRIGFLEKALPLEAFVEKVKEGFGVKQVSVAGDSRMPVQCVAVCSGSGSGLLKNFLASEAEVYVSGDLKYHDGMEVRAAGRALVDVGHFETEAPVVAALVEKLRSLAGARKWALTISGYRRERNPYVTG